ncbi:hypothetical protein ACFXOS_14750 [Streptomyces sp. NPDC059175]|uniref:BclA C-terminal domain-containing protein n=1 Tax=Streptomyces sp. NPDC059175 TaxID=3346757 RepID=UPI00367EC02F
MHGSVFWKKYRSRQGLLTASVLTSLALVLPAAGVAHATGADQEITSRMKLSEQTARPDRGCDRDKHKDCQQILDVGASIYADDNQQIPSTSTTQINFSEAVYDTDSMFDSANSTLVVRTPGRYLLKSRVRWMQVTPTAGTSLNLSILVNGNAYATDVKPASTGDQTQEVSTIVPLNAGDVISLNVFQTTGSTATSVAASGSSGVRTAPQLQAELLVPACSAPWRGCNP